MRIVKSNSSKWVNKQKFVKGTFRWQEGYWACSRQVSCFDAIINYIKIRSIIIHVSRSEKNT